MWFKFWIFVWDWNVYGKETESRLKTSWVCSSFTLKTAGKHALLYVSKPLMRLSDTGIYATGTVKTNRKLIPTIKTNKQIKLGEHEWLYGNDLAAVKCMDSISVILLTNYFNANATQQIDLRLKWSKKKSGMHCKWA